MGHEFSKAAPKGRAEWRAEVIRCLAKLESTYGRDHRHQDDELLDVEPMKWLRKRELEAMSDSQIIAYLITILNSEGSGPAATPRSRSPRSRRPSAGGLGYTDEASYPRLQDLLDASNNSSDCMYTPPKTTLAVSAGVYHKTQTHPINYARRASYFGPQPTCHHPRNRKRLYSAPRMSRPTTLLLTPREEILEDSLLLCDACHAASATKRVPPRTRRVSLSPTPLVRGISIPSRDMDDEGGRVRRHSTYYVQGYHAGHFDMTNRTSLYRDTTLHRQPTLHRQSTMHYGGRTSRSREATPGQRRSRRDSSSGPRGANGYVTHRIINEAQTRRMSYTSTRKASIGRNSGKTLSRVTLPSYQSGGCHGRLRKSYTRRRSGPALFRSSSSLLSESLEPVLTHPSILCEMVRQSPLSIRFIPPPCRTSRICFLAVSKNPEAFAYVPSGVANYLECGITAIRRAHTAVQHISLRSPHWPKLIEIASRKWGTEIIDQYLPLPLEVAEAYGGLEAQLSNHPLIGPPGLAKIPSSGNNTSNSSIQNDMRTQSANRRKVDEMEDYYKWVEELDAIGAPNHLVS
eukprot:Blabericola_migrator_1__1793@NODE_1486_length_4441_cov_149_315501_g296_i1_p1_GENE_NODE_1486_length_4441_cov_149_315501_g296_i1NODE_1486_length_4441_cov_149_315501_g296_i1_p1_ORF_typecomplete_len573_score37_68_NODE_1486_length_4441_cov_149_315501_g296_i126864404